MQAKQQAAELLEGFKGKDYVFGLDVLEKAGQLASQCGKSVLVFANDLAWVAPLAEKVLASLDEAGLEVAAGRYFEAARPNAPREDVYRIESVILHHQPDCVLSMGGGSSIDAVKAGNVLATLGGSEPDIDSYFGVGKVTEALQAGGKRLRPHLAIQTAASSAAHLTKYANITDLVEGQKKLIVDEAIVPSKALFDYAVTRSAPAELTIDGALDGMSHCLEVFYGIGREHYDLLEKITLLAFELAVEYAPLAVKAPDDPAAREGLGLETDLGGQAIMIGGTSGGHLTSFSLVDVTSHGRACGIMNPYYSVFFAPAIEPQLQAVGGVFKKAGFISADLKKLSGRDLGLAVAEGMVGFSKSIGAATTLAELEGFSDRHIDRALKAAKDPQLEMKLKNMPVPLDASLVDEYMGPILQAAKTGRFDLIKNLSR